MGLQIPRRSVSGQIANPPEQVMVGDGCWKGSPFHPPSPITLWYNCVGYHAMRTSFKPSYLIYAALIVLILAFLLIPGPRQQPVKAGFAPAAAAPKPDVPPYLAARYESIARGLDMARVKTDIDALASYSSRVAGYPGSGAAADYVESRFKALGLRGVGSERFNVTIPVDEGSRLVTSGREFRLHALWPNLVRTSELPPEGLAGPVDRCAPRQAPRLRR